MGCDGIWETKSNQEMVDFIYSNLNKNKEKVDLKEVISELMNDIISPDYTQTGNDYFIHIIYLLF